MKYRCNHSTDLDDLFGTEQYGSDGWRFRYGPIAQAMKNGEELILENSAALSQLTLAKIALLIRDLLLVETEERIRPGSGFHLVLN